MVVSGVLPVLCALHMCENRALTQGCSVGTMKTLLKKSRKSVQTVYRAFTDISKKSVSTPHAADIRNQLIALCGKNISGEGFVIRT